MANINLKVKIEEGMRQPESGVSYYQIFNSNSKHVVYILYAHAYLATEEYVAG